VNLTSSEICKLCDKLQLGPATYIPETDSVQVYVPPTRSDILHAVDIIEDVAIAYGYNNIVQEVPKTLTVGAPLPINLFTDLLRAEISRAGYVEMLTHGLCSTVENFTFLRRPLGPAVSLSNPANVEYEVVRTTLFPGALKTLAFNESISHKDGIKLFEISDIVVPSESEVGATNVRKMVALSSGYSAGFEIIHGLVDHVMTMAQIQPELLYAQNSLTSEQISERQRVAKQGMVYYIRAGVDPIFFPGMNAELVLKYSDGREVVAGVFGAIHPEVLEKFEIL
jgi:phenylalanyl-tRNA synthetase beta chain